jgi:hypothetical protein
VPSASLALQAGVEEMGAGTVEFETGRRSSVIARGSAGARRRQPRQSAAADKEQGGPSGTERIKKREEKKGWKQNGGAVQPRRGRNGFALGLGSNAREIFSKASRKPTGVFNGDFLPWHEGDEENFATFSSRPRRCNVVVGLVGCYAFRVFFFESEGVFKNGGACFRVQDCWLWRESLGIA